MIIRWGNAVQWNEKEIGRLKNHTKEKIEPYFNVFFEDVLTEIENHIPGKKNGF